MHDPTALPADPGAAARWAGAAPLRVLVGPYERAIHCEYMAGAFDDSDALTFGTWEGADVPAAAGEDLAAVLARLPEGWTPDLMILWRPEYHSIPRGLEHAPFPVATLISDWYLAYTDCLAAARFVDVVVTGTRGERVLRAAGVERVLALPMLGYQPEIDGAVRSSRRDIDVLCAGNPNWTVHREREQVVHELMHLPPDVVFRHPPYVDRATYNRYLGRSKIFVNHTVVGEINMKVYEATAAGVCLFVERDNLDVPSVLRDGESVVLFDRSDVRAKVLHYLHHDDEREAIAAAGQRSMRARTYRQNVREIVETLRRIGPVGLRARPRPAALDGRAALEHAAACVRHGAADPSPMLPLVDAATPGDSPRETHLRALILLRARNGAGVTTPLDPAFRRSVRRAWDAAPDDAPLNLLALATALDAGDTTTARACCERAVDQYGRGVVDAFDPTTAFALGEPRRYALERDVWEALERGGSTSHALGRHLVDLCLGTTAAHLASTGATDEAIAMLRRAVSTFPEGEWSRPLLARCLAKAGRWAECAHVLAEHLAMRPLDLDASLLALNTDVQLRELGAARERLALLQRASEVLEDDEWRTTVQTLGSRLDRLVAATTSRSR